MLWVWECTSAGRVSIGCIICFQASVRAPQHLGFVAFISCVRTPRPLLATVARFFEHLCSYHREIHTLAA